MGRKAEISQFDHDVAILSLFTQKVLRLEVSVHDAKVVHVVAGKAQLLNDACCLAFSERVHRFNAVEKIASRDQLHDHIVVSLVLH